MTVGLLAIALQEMGINARSWQGWQIPIRTDAAHGAARIIDIDGARLIERLAQGQVAVIAGFQGIGPDNRIATLGRGGSDTSAVAIAAALDADRCDIYTDVDGVYTTDPRIVPKARRLPQGLLRGDAGDGLARRQGAAGALGRARHGARRADLRALELRRPGRAGPDRTPTSRREPSSATRTRSWKSRSSRGIAYSKDEAQISLRRVADKPGVAAAVFGPLAEANINVDMIVQNVSEDGTLTDMTFTVPIADYDRARGGAGEAPRRRSATRSIQGSTDVAKVSVIGIGMRSHAGVAAERFQGAGRARASTSARSRRPRSRYRC